MSLLSYSSYEDSGIEWLGKVPSHWTVAPLKRGFSVALGKMLQPERKAIDDTLQPYLRAANIQWSGVDTADVKQMWFSAAELESLRLLPGDLLVSEGGDVGRACLWAGELEDCYFQNSVNRVRPLNRNSNAFLRYWISALKDKGFIDVLCNKSTIAHFTAEKVQAVPTPFPPPEEQLAIAEFLNRETGKIDALVAEQERLIELLKEKRQAVISHAVTKGLDPTAPMKDSGVEWIGEVPAHWGICQLTRIAERVVVGIAEAATHAYADQGTPILRTTNVRPRKLVGEILYLDPLFADERSSKMIRAGDLLTVRTGEPGTTVVVPKELDGCQCFTMLITTLAKGNDPDFYSYWMNSVPAKHYFALEGWGSAQQNISVPILKALPITLPPRSEQLEIVRSLNAADSGVSSLIAEAQRAIDLLKEHRSALISAAVTGKIDVRGLIDAGPPTRELEPA